jgi:hypothetical protein
LRIFDPQLSSGFWFCPNITGYGYINLFLHLLV